MRFITNDLLHLGIDKARLLMKGITFEVTAIHFIPFISTLLAVVCQ